ncbi:GRB2-related adapter protein 2b [Spinachia spinachia]
MNLQPMIGASGLLLGRPPPGPADLGGLAQGSCPGPPSASTCPAGPRRTQEDQLVEKPEGSFLVRGSRDAARGDFCLSARFAGEEKDELEFGAGDVIEVVECSDPVWWRGRLGGRTGLFPSNYTEPLRGGGVIG